MSLLSLGYRRLWLLSCFLSSVSSQLHHVTKQAAMLWIALWRGPWEKEARVAFSQWPVRNWGLQFNSLHETEFCQQSHKWAWKWVFPHLSLKMFVFPANTLITASWETMNWRSRVNSAWILKTIEIVGWNILFEPLNLGVHVR